MTLHELGLVLVASGVASVMSYNAGLKEGMARAARRWRGR